MTTENQLPVIHLETLQPSVTTSNDLACAIVESVLSGFVNPLDLPVKKKCIEQALEAALKNPGVQSCIIEEIQKHGKFANHLGAKLEVIEAGVSYDYSVCKDSHLDLLEIELASKKQQVDDRKKFLKTIPAEGLEILTSQGEVLTIYPPAKSSTTTIKTTMK